VVVFHGGGDVEVTRLDELLIFEKGARRSSRSSALMDEKESTMFRCPGCRSNTHTTHTIRLDTEQKVVAPDALHSRLLKHTSIRIEIHKDIIHV
jgi:hypothetical protein